jgi:hypothetical protein
MFLIFCWFCVSAVELRERILVWKREKKKAASSLWRVYFCPDAWVQVEVWCECDGVAMISAVAQYAGRQSVLYCAKSLCTVYFKYATISCLPLSHKTTVADNYNIFSNNGKLTLLPMYGLSLMSYATKKILQTPHKGTQSIIVCVYECACGNSWWSHKAVSRAVQLFVFGICHNKSG